ncbi:MAG TPA: amidohydrolase family protein [Bryobacteraceae bacterium]|nr:amidohydrolase family protein [Bryobacteraceae bacterium]
MIWDLHCHLGGFEGRTPDEKMAEMIRYADRMGVDRLCVFMGYPFVTDPSPETLRQQNDQVLQALSHWRHRAVGFVYLNPRHLQFSLDELNRCVRDGPMVGVKLWVAERAARPNLDPIIERAAELKAVIFQHTWIKTGGNLAGESTPMELAELARRHPAVSIICGHTGGNWEVGLRVIRGVKNLYSDLAGSDPTAGYTEMAVREVGAERVIYGSDIGGRSFASQLAKVAGAEIPEAARRRILGENLRSLMQPILAAKGMNL